MASRIRLLAIPAVVAASACGSSTIPAPRMLELVEPAGGIGYLGQDNVVVIDGENFSDDVIPDAGNPDESKVRGIRISLMGADKEVDLIDPTFLSATRFQATLPTSLTPGSFDILMLLDEEIEGSLPSLRMGWEATHLFVSSTGQEPAPGDANQVTMEFELRADNEELGILKEGFTFTPQFLGTNHSVTNGEERLVGAGETFETGTITVTDSSAEVVLVTLGGVPSTIEQPPPGALDITFVPGTPVKARLLPAAELNATDNFADTFFQVEDFWGNPCTVHAEYNASFSFSACVTATANPDPVIVPANTGIVPVRVNCPVSNDAIVLFNENTATGYPNGGATVIEFN